MQLNTTQSIVDNFKSLGLPSDFPTRASVFKNLGLEERLGKYVGSGTQNPNYIKALKGFTPDQLKGALKAPLSQPTTQIAPQPTFPQQQKEQIAQTTPTTIETPSGGSVPITGTDILSSLGISDIPNAQDVVSQVMNAPQFQTFQNRQATNETLNSAEAQAQKQRLETENAAKVRSFQNQLERNGLSLSGNFQVGTSQLLDELAASKLGVDRVLAGKLLNSNFDLQEEIGKQATTIINNARQGRQDAIRALEATGLTVVGDQVVPTLAASNAARSEASATAAQQRFEAGQEATEARFQQNQQGLEAQRAESNALRQQSIAIQQQNAATLQALRNLQTKQLEQNLDNPLRLLTGKQKNDYTLFSMVGTEVNRATLELNRLQSKNFGVYKTLLESAKPYANVSRDQNWVKITASIERAQAQYRNAIFGATLTGYEREAANSFLIDFKTDDLATMQTKLQGIQNFVIDYQSALLNSTKPLNAPITGGGNVDISGLNFKF